MITFEDFKKLEIKIGTVLSAEKVEGTDRLLKVIADIGDRDIQVVAGFGHILDSDDLVGKQVPLVVNIEPTEIRGVTSEGIFLAIDENNDHKGAVLLVPEEKVRNGGFVI